MKQMVASQAKSNSQSFQRRRSRSKSDFKSREKSSESKKTEEVVKIKTEDGKETEIKVEGDKNGRLSKDRSRASSKHDSRAGRDVRIFFSSFSIRLSVYFFLQRRRSKPRDPKGNRAELLTFDKIRVRFCNYCYLLKNNFSS